MKLYFRIHIYYESIKTPEECNKTIVKELNFSNFNIEYIDEIYKIYIRNLQNYHLSINYDFQKSFLGETQINDLKVLNLCGSTINGFIVCNFEGKETITPYNNISEQIEDGICVTCNQKYTNIIKLEK
jgi:hypothetical protein